MLKLLTCTMRFSGGGVCPRDREEPSSHLVRIRVRVRVRVGVRVGVRVRVRARVRVSP